MEAISVPCQVKVHKVFSPSMSGLGFSWMGEDPSRASGMPSGGLQIFKEVQCLNQRLDYCHSEIQDNFVTISHLLKKETACKNSSI